MPIRFDDVIALLRTRFDADISPLSPRRFSPLTLFADAIRCLRHAADMPRHCLIYAFFAFMPPPAVSMIISPFRCRFFAAFRLPTPPLRHAFSLSFRFFFFFRASFLRHFFRRRFRFSPFFLRHARCFSPLIFLPMMLDISLSAVLILRRHAA